MKIEIKQRYRPFSHAFARQCLLPGTTYAFRFYPARFELWDWNEQKILKTFDLSIRGPVRDFTVLQDLEKQCLIVWMHTLDGYIRYHLASVSLYLECGEALKINGTLLKKGESFHLLNETTNTQRENTPSHMWERLSLGCHKQSLWEAMQQRKDLVELLPYWFHLAQQYATEQVIEKGTLLAKAKDLLEAKDKNQLSELLSTLYTCLFNDMLLPLSKDQSFQGIELPLSHTKISPLLLLGQTYQVIKKQFLSFDNGELSLLPCLLPQFHCGRFTHLHCGSLGKICIEWSKKLLKKCVIQVENTQTCSLRLQRDLLRFRLREHPKSKGSSKKALEELTLEAGKTYYLDRFEK